jgi:hypothetical protein
MTLEEKIKEISNINPYKEPGNRGSYDKYNEGWSDACDTLGDEIIKLIKKELQKLSIKYIALSQLNDDEKIDMISYHKRIEEMNNIDYTQKILENLLK